MLEKGVIERSTSPWSSPTIIVKKKDGKPRFCNDCRKLNEASEKDAYPLPYISHILDQLRQANYFSTIDLKQGYWQVPLTPESKPLTAFTVSGRDLFQYRVMPFGLHSTPATFQPLLDLVIGTDIEPFVFAYLDDIVVASRTFDDHLDYLRKVLACLQEANLRVNVEKYRFAQREIRYLGHVVTRQGTKQTLTRSQPSPRSPHQVVPRN